ncbi:MAG: hypothetical protein V3U60_05620 [Gammaproteobacteria bacterium]
MTASNDISADIPGALSRAWDQKAAEKSLERWRAVCRQEGWGEIPENLSLLVAVFGASWYFTRFIFFHGQRAARLFDCTPTEEFSLRILKRRLDEAIRTYEKYSPLDALRIAKNEIMLEILLSDLRQTLDQEHVESALTNLADATLVAAITACQLKDDADTIGHVAVLGMGRMAGSEMNYGSDLDLIFLLPEELDDVFARVSKRVRMILRELAVMSPHGVLYEIDMRLRPHGTAGALVTPLQAFIEYHAQERAIWERQMMTRCRAVVDKKGIGRRALDVVLPHIYGRYRDEYLRGEVRHMRQRVEKELGSPAGKYDIKKGRGGIMDIDFITHYLQLAHGYDTAGLRTASTRVALRAGAAVDLLKADIAERLANAYDFLKRVEGRIRVFDMKPLHTFSRDPGDLHTLARAMGYKDSKSRTDVEQFTDDYKATTGYVRDCFKKIVTAN